MLQVLVVLQKQVRHFIQLSLENCFKILYDKSMTSLASTWAGWAVSALTSKFNRIQSQQSVAGQVGQGPVSGRSKGRYAFGAQSSSSTSTTTSSIPSTPSVDRDVLQPTAEGQESATDYDDDFDNDDWGSIEGDDRTKSTSNHLDSHNQSSTGSSPSVLSSKNTGSRPADTDGWDSWAIDEAVSNVCPR